MVAGSRVSVSPIFAKSTPKTAPMVLAGSSRWKRGLIALLKTMKPLDEDFPEI